MTWILTAVVILYLIAMLIVWSQYGFFNALLHLLIVIISGAIALALWEPLVVGFLLGRMPLYAWGVGLLGPFALLLIGLHVLTDKLAGMNVNVLDIVDKAGGAALGLLSGILTAGFIVLGISFLPVPAAMLGYQPYSITPATGDIERTQSLYPPVDRITAGLFTGLSRGAFSTDTPLATHQPNLARQAGLFRLKPQADEFASPVAVPGTVTVDDYYLAQLEPDALPSHVKTRLAAAGAANRRIALVSTTWNNQKPGTYDSDALRVFPTQMRLVAVGKGGRATLIPPFALQGKTDTTHTEPYFIPVDSDGVGVIGVNQTEPIDMAFIVPDGLEPRFVLVRHLRLDLPDDPTLEGAKLAEAFAPPAPEPQQPETGDGDGPSQQPAAEGELVTDNGMRFVTTDRLPVDFNANAATGLDIEDNAVTGGKATVEDTRTRGSRTRVSHIDSPSHLLMVRVQVPGSTVHTLFGQAGRTAASVQGVTLTDADDNKWNPYAYVWQREDGTLVVEARSAQPFRAASDIEALQRMRAGDSIYLYFRVNKNARIISYQFGGLGREDIDFQVGSGE